MNKERSETSLYDRVHFKMISFVHDTLYGLFVNPYKLLDSAGLKPGQKVLEVGCGPGFFTIPAAKIVGEKGRVYALDVNPVAVETVRRKIKEKGLKNVEVMLADASETGLPDKSIDVSFLFGVIHALDNVDAVMQEMHRVLKAKGVLSIQKSWWWSEKKLLDVVTKKGLFSFKEKTNRVFKFEKS
ncbi:class I SAM-dependent methyltransferase [Candidatus Bathyarchaeota archaeon]|nr:MAG: class I SAM-dependent methyltransferase [Candidatus Bathyarchaeota archaeon]